jgi:hypothetical protein
MRVLSSSVSSWLGVASTLLEQRQAAGWAQQTEKDSSGFTLAPADRYSAALSPFSVKDAPAAVCTADDNGFSTTPDGVKVS